MAKVIDIGETGLVNSLKAMDLISHNIANVNVAGYKRERPVVSAADFGAALDSLGSPAVKYGKPDLISVTDHAQGSLARTANALDLAIEGAGLFVVETPGGIAYSRAGNFTLDEQGRLLLGGEYPLLAEHGEIVLTTQIPRITQTGEIYDGETLVGKIRLGFPGESDLLEKIGGYLYRSERPLVETSEEISAVRQGFLEGSNIQQVDEMVAMLQIQRQVEMTQRLIRGYDDMTGEAISIIAEF